MFKQQSQGAYIPTKSVVVKPEAQVDISPSGVNQVRFLIPQYLGFLDPRGTTLNYDIVISDEAGERGRGMPIPNGRAGVHSCWRDFRLQDGTGSTTLEEIQDYNVLTSQWWGYTQNDSIAAKRNMFEGRQVNPAVNRNVYYKGENDWVAGAVTSADAVLPTTLNIRQPIYSGILSGNKIFPVVATQGLRLQMTLDNISRSLTYATGQLGIGETTGGNFPTMTLDSGACGLKVAKAIGDDAKNAIGQVKFCTIQNPANGPGGRGVNNKNEPCNNNPFATGDMLFINNAGLTTESLGVITGFQPDGDNDLQINYIPNRANTAGLVAIYPVGSSVFVKSVDRLNGLVVLPANMPVPQITEAALKTNYTIKNISMVCAVVSPPEQYVKSLMAQIGSSKGMAMDFKTYALHRVNLNALNGLTNQLIPANSARAYSILSVPLSQKKQLQLSADSLQGQVDGCQNYQYVLGGHLIPDRPIDLVKYTNVVPHVDALHLIELEKALVNCGYGVRDLQRVPQRFLLGRGFSKYGQVADLSQRDLSLRVEYVDATEQKLFNHYICHLRRMIISPAGVNAF